MGSDKFMHGPISSQKDFNPRSPHGERHFADKMLRQFSQFQSTLPAWGATNQISLMTSNMVFQSTLPAWGATVNYFHISLLPEFQSTLPAWGATDGEKHVGIYLGFQSTLPAWGATGCRQVKQADDKFQSTLPAWGATRHIRFQGCWQLISIHAPRMGSDEKSLYTSIWT